MATDHLERIRVMLDGFGIENVVAGLRWETLPDRAVILLDAPGLPPIRLLNGLTSEIKREGVQILVRGDANNPGECKRRAREIYDYMRDYDNLGAPYYNVEPLGGPQTMDPDEEERPRYSLNFYLFLKE